MSENKEKIKIESIEPVESLQNCNIYIVKFRKGAGAVVELYYRAKNDDDAKERGKKFCTKHNFSLVFVKPFLTDLNEWPTL